MSTKCVVCRDQCVCDIINNLFIKGESISNQVLILDFSHFFLFEAKKSFYLFMNYCCSNGYLSMYKNLLADAVERKSNYSFFSSTDKNNKFIGNIHQNNEIIPKSDLSHFYAISEEPIIRGTLNDSAKSFSPHEWINDLKKGKFGGNSIVLVRNFPPFQSIVYLVLKNPVDGFNDLFNFSRYHELKGRDDSMNSIANVFQILDNLLINEMFRVVALSEHIQKAIIEDKPEDLEGYRRLVGIPTTELKRRKRMFQ